jgi:hypothetical protein
MSEIDICYICEEEKSLHKNVCPTCYMESIKYKTIIQNVTQYELYGIILQKEFEGNDYFHLAQINVLKQYLSNIFKQNSMFNEKIHTKCNCGLIHKKNFNFKNLPHGLVCKHCDNFCSNCKHDTHTDYQQYVPTSKNVTCDEFNKTYQTYHSTFVQKWISSIINNKREHDKIKIKIKNENASLQLLSKQDLRICPYTDYHYAKQFENNGGSRSYQHLTDTYTEENWHKVACQSDPVIKTDCDDMYCRQHNPEKVSAMTRRGINIEKNNKGCGRRINWVYWKKVTPKIDTNVHGNTIIKNSDINQCTMSHSIQTEYICDICNNLRTCMSISCTYSKCCNNRNQVCGICIADKLKILKKRAHFNKTMITILNDDGATLNFQKNTEGKFVGNIYFDKHSKDHCNAYMEWDDNLKHWYIRSLGNGDYINYGHFENLHKNFQNDVNTIRTVTKFMWNVLKNPRNVESYGFYSNPYGIRSYGIRSYEARPNRTLSSVIIETIHTDEVYNNLQKYTCVQDKHVLYFHNYDSFFKRMNEFDKWTTEYNSIRTIVRAIKRYKINKKRYEMSVKINKIIKLYLFNMQRDSAAATLNFAFNYHLIRKKWVGCLDQMKILIELEPIISIYMGEKYEFKKYNHYKITSDQ